MAIYVGNKRYAPYIGDKRRRYMGGGSSLPYDAEIEYLRGTGTQYIDSGIECTGDLSIKCKFRTSTNVNSALAGGIYNFDSTYFRHHLSPSSNNAYWLQNNMADAASVLFGSLGNYKTNTWYVFDIDATNGTCVINGTTKTFTPVSSSITTNANYGIFGRLSSNLATQIRSGNVDICYFQLLMNGVLLRDFIPVRVGQVGYLYDRVSGRLFGNSGTGNFTLGQDIVPVEYLQGDGNAYIDLGLKATGNISIEMDTFDFFVESNKTKWPFGVKDSGVNNLTGVYINGNSGAVTFAYKSTNITFSSYTAFASNTKITVNNGVVTVGNESKNYTVSSFTTTRNMILFGIDYNGSVIPSQAKIGATYYSDGTNVLDLIPVRIGTTGYMLDRTSHKLFGNSGTGSFTLGPDKT